MALRRSLTTLSLIVAVVTGGAALFAKPANASGPFSEAGVVALARFDSPMERIQRWFALWPRAVARSQDPAGKEGAAIVVGGKEGAAIVVGGIANPVRSREGVTEVDLDLDY